MDLGDDALQKLFEKENSFGFNFIRLNDDLFEGNVDRQIKEVRSKAITWILQTRSDLALKFETVYLALMYFDRVVSADIPSNLRYPITLSIQSTLVAAKSPDLRNAISLSIVCVSVAARATESRFIPLSDFTDGDLNINMEMRNKMESLVLYVLGFRMHYVTPFSFLPFFIKELCMPPFPAADDDTHSVYTKKVTRLILLLLTDINVVEIRPSSVAAGTILAAMGWFITSIKELKTRMGRFSITQFLDIESVFGCHDLICYSSKIGED